MRTTGNKTVADTLELCRRRKKKEDVKILQLLEDIGECTGQFR